MNTERLNVIYGGLTPDVTNVIFTQGMNDPWRSLGVQEDLNSLAPAFVIPGKWFLNFHYIYLLTILFV